MLPLAHPYPPRPAVLSVPASTAAPPTLPDKGEHLADALDQLHRTAPQEIGTPGALGADLLADALLQHGLAHLRQPPVVLEKPNAQWALNASLPNSTVEPAP